MTSYITTNDDCQIAYQYHVNSNKPTLVLSNSLGTTVEMWQPQLDELKQHFSLLTYDMRGHGQSSVMPGGYSIDRLGCDLIELLDHLKLSQVFFCGLSIGGMIGQWLAVVKPERINALVLANTSAHAGPASLWNQRLATIAKDGLQSTWPMVRERWVSHDFAEKFPDDVQRLQRMFETMDQQGYIGACTAVRDMDMRNIAKLNTLPTLVIAGSKDTASPLDRSAFLIEQYQTSELLVLQAGHLSNIEQANEFTQAVIDFFDN